jgi:hypothetical protein
MVQIRSAAALVLLLSQGVPGAAAAQDEIRREPVHFAKSASSAVIQGEIKGRADVDYVVRASAGQTLSVKLEESNPANYFNVLPPGSPDAAMFVGDTGEDYTGLLPEDGDYVVRVYLVRAAARRGESSRYTLTIGVTGGALAPVAASQDALVPGTPYHATTKVKCVPAYESAARDCDASVIRRGFDGTATVDIAGKTGKRSILFVKGQPVASNASIAVDPMSFDRSGDTVVVKFGASERYEIPDALLTGG